MASTLTFMLLFWMFSSYDIINIKIERDLNISNILYITCLQTDLQLYVLLL